MCPVVLPATVVPNGWQGARWSPAWSWWCGRFSTQQLSYLWCVNPPLWSCPLPLVAATSTCPPADVCVCVCEREGERKRVSLSLQPTQTEKWVRDISIESVWLSTFYRCVTNSWYHNHLMSSWHIYRIRMLSTFSRCVTNSWYHMRTCTAYTYSKQICEFHMISWVRDISLESVCLSTFYRCVTKSWCHIMSSWHIYRVRMSIHIL